jgi:DNA-binding transcriptional ArsR family regulator
MEDGMNETVSTTQNNEELLTFFKALSDQNRLKIVGLLAVQPHSGEELAAALDLGASTVSHHLALLREAGLVAAHAESYYNIYSLQPTRLEEMSKRLLARENLVKLAEDVDGAAFSKRVLHDFITADGRMKAFPAQQKKYLVILEQHILPAFEFDRRYSEKELNEVLKRFNEDFASIRRDLIAFKFMARENNIYWRI